MICAIGKAHGYSAAAHGCSFLVEQNYDISAIPHNYIVQPPSDVQIVNQNLAIVRDVIQQLDKERQPVAMFSRHC